MVTRLAPPRRPHRADPPRVPWSWLPHRALIQLLHPCRNILSLINAFDLPEQSVSRDDYTAVLTHLNATQPERVAGLHLEACRLQDFLDKVLGAWPRRGWGWGAGRGGCTEPGCGWSWAATHRGRWPLGTRPAGWGGWSEGRASGQQTDGV